MIRFFDETWRGIKAVRRAELVLDLDELQALARRELRPWVTLAEWVGVRAPAGRTWDDRAAKQDRMRAARALRRCGAVLVMRTPPQDSPEDSPGLEIHVDAEDVRRVVEPEVRLARLFEARRAKDDESAQGIEAEGELLSPATITLEYRGTLSSFKLLQRKHGIGWARLRKMISSQGPVPSRLARVRTEQRRPAALMLQARRAADEGADTGTLAVLLDCSRRTVERWLRREGYQASGLGPGATWSKGAASE